MRAAVAGVVVNYNAREHLLTCVGSLLGAGVGEVVVADNGSGDGSELALLERYPAARWAPTGGNLGYGRAANVGVRLVDAPFVLVCNADVEVRPGSVAPLAATLGARPEAAVVGPRVLDAEGRLYPSARRFPDLAQALGHAFLGQFWAGNPFTRRYRMNDWDHSERRDVDWVSGCCFLVRKQAWDAVGGFDPRYFMYMEDVDLCWRLHRAGWGVIYEPAAAVVHVQGVSTDRHPYRMLLAHHVSMWQFARRTATGAQRWWLALVLPGLALRLALTVGSRAIGGWVAQVSGSAVFKRLGGGKRRGDGRRREGRTPGPRRPPAGVGR